MFYHLWLFINFTHAPQTVFHPSIDSQSWPMYYHLWLYQLHPCPTNILPSLHRQPIMTHVLPSLALSTSPMPHKQSSTPPSTAYHDPCTTTFGKTNSTPCYRQSIIELFCSLYCVVFSPLQSSGSSLFHRRRSCLLSHYSRLLFW